MTSFDYSAQGSLLTMSCSQDWSSWIVEPQFLCNRMSQAYSKRLSKRSLAGQVVPRLALRGDLLGRVAGNFEGPIPR